MEAAGAGVNWIALSVARQRRRDGLKLAVSVLLAHLMSDQFQSVFVYW